MNLTPRVFSRLISWFMGNKMGFNNFFKRRFFDGATQNAIDEREAGFGAIFFGQFDGFVDGYPRGSFGTVKKFPDGQTQNGQVDFVNFFQGPLGGIFGDDGVDLVNFADNFGDFLRWRGVAV